MTLGEFQERLRALGGRRFETFVVDVLRTSGRFTNIQQDRSLDGMQVDITAEETDSLSTRPRTWFVETKLHKVLTLRDAEELAGRKQALARHSGSMFIVAVGGSVTRNARVVLEHTGIEIWDAVKLLGLASEEVIAAYFGTEVDLPEGSSESTQKGASLLTSLQNTPPGKPDWLAFERLTSDVLEFLFCPPLEPPRYQDRDAAQRNIRDLVFENAAAQGFWLHVRETYSAHYVVVDAKNYVGYVPKRSVLEISHYLKPYGCGMFGLIVSRRGAGGAAQHAQREQWIGGSKLIVVLSDAEVSEMLRLKSEGGSPEEILRELIASFRLSL